MERVIIKELHVDLGDSHTGHADASLFEPGKGSPTEIMMTKLKNINRVEPMGWQAGTGGTGMASNGSSPAYKTGYMYQRVINLHNSGHFSSSFRNAYEKRYGKEVELDKDAKIATLLMYGTVDAPDWSITKEFFKKDYINQIKTSFYRGKVFICTIPPRMDNHWKYYKPIKNEINPIIREIALETGAGLIETFDALNNESLFHTDKVHLNSQGRAVLGNLKYHGVKSYWAKEHTTTAPPVEPATYKEATDWEYWSANSDGIIYYELDKFWVWIPGMNHTIPQYGEMSGKIQLQLYWLWRNTIETPPSDGIDVVKIRKFLNEINVHTHDIDKVVANVITEL